MEKNLPRRAARENAFLVLFAATFDDQPLEELLAQNQEDGEHVVDAFGEQLLRMYYNHSAEVNDLISARLRNWTMKRLPRVTLSVLRLGVAELVYSPDKKPGVAINEAVELSKKYGADEDYQFVNGLLGSVARDLHIEGADEAPQETEAPAPEAEKPQE
ncbi:MAG: transcription antitermination factor NusB [Faecalibacterium sp.]|jgi:N utilization substance protein B|nr:transcription antitermination factor NusB [Faecalibacterium sp.]